MDIKESETIIFLMHNDILNRESQWDGYITSVREDGVDVCYLEGHKSRNDFIPFSKVVAIVDKDQEEKWVHVGDYEGSFRWVNTELANQYIEKYRANKCK